MKFELPIKRLTSTVEPRAARARMSAQETVWGHASSNLALISSITSNPLIEFLFGPDPFSLTMLALSSNKMDASQPCKNQTIEQQCPSKCQNYIVIRRKQIHESRKASFGTKEKQRYNSSTWSLSKKRTIVFSNLHKTVMEVKPKERGSHPGLFCNGFLQDWQDNVVSLRAWALIEAWKETRKPSSGMEATIPAKINTRVGKGECGRMESRQHEKARENFEESHCEQLQF